MNNPLGEDDNRIITVDFYRRVTLPPVSIYDDQAQPPLKGEEPDGTSSNMDRELIDAKLATVEARTDAKFAELKGEITSGQERIATMFAELRADLATQQGATNTAIADLRGDLKTAQSDTQGKFDTVKASVDAKPGKFEIWSGFVALFVAFVAILAFGGDRLSTGIGLADQRQEQLERDREQDNSSTQINSKLDKLLLNSQ